jgi:hypothetical protein
VTWKRTAIDCVERVTGDGEIDCPSISRCAGEVTSLMSTVPLPDVGQPFAEVGGGPGFAFTTAVGTEVAEFEPSAFFAVTRTRIVLATSTVFKTYVLSVAPLIEAQLPPSLSQRRHW